MLHFIKELDQLDNKTFCIVWSDDKRSILSLPDLQRSCPCARCQETKKEVEEDLRAIKISSVGNYALRIDFTRGCSRGIFTFQLLRKIHLVEAF